MEKTNKICTLFAATVLLSCAAVAQAGPVNFKSVPADAKWLAHVDVDAARSSTVVRAFFAAVLKECPQRRSTSGTSARSWAWSMPPIFTA